MGFYFFTKLSEFVKKETQSDFPETILVCAKQRTQGQKRKYKRK